MSSADQVDEEMVVYSTLPFFILGVVRVGLACFGIVTNIISICVLTNKSIWSATSILLIALLVYDTFFLFTGAVVILAGLPENEETHLFIIMTVVYPFRYIAQMGSVYSTVAVTIERFIVVVKPLRARSIWTFNNARKVTLGVFLFSIFFNIPRCFIFHRLSSNAWLENVTVAQGNGTQEYVYTTIYEVYLTMVVFFLIPYTVILLLNIKLIVHLRLSARRTKKLSVKTDNRVCSSPTEKEDGVTVIVLGITACFIVCCVVPFAYHMTLLSDLDMLSQRTKEYLMAIGDTMLCINSATNFIFYCLLGKRFRVVFFKLFCPCRSTKGRKHTDNQNWHALLANH